MSALKGLLLKPGNDVHGLDSYDYVFSSASRAAWAYTRAEAGVGVTAAASEKGASRCYLGCAFSVNEGDFRSGGHEHGDEGNGFASEDRFGWEGLGCANEYNCI